MTYYVLIVIHLLTRRVQIAGTTPQPASAFMMQVGRNLTDPFDGFLVGKRFLIMDRDPKYTKEFRELLKEAGTQIVRLPARSPNLNAYGQPVDRASGRRGSDSGRCAMPPVPG